MKSNGNRGGGFGELAHNFVRRTVLNPIDGVSFWKLSYAAGTVPAVR